MWKWWRPNTLLFLITDLREAQSIRFSTSISTHRDWILGHKLTQQQNTLAKSQNSRETGRAATSHCSLRWFSGPQRLPISCKPDPFSPRMTTPEKDRRCLSSWHDKRLKSSNLHPEQQLLYWISWAKKTTAQLPQKLQFRFIFFFFERDFLRLQLNNTLTYQYHLKNKHSFWFQVRNHSPSQK